MKYSSAAERDGPTHSHQQRSNSRSQLKLHHSATQHTSLPAPNWLERVFASKEKRQDA